MAISSIRWHSAAAEEAFVAIQRAKFKSYLFRLSDAQILDILEGKQARLFNANNPHWYDASVNAVAALLNSGFMEIYSGSQPAADGSLTGTKLAKLTFSATAFGNSSGGVATANAIGSVTALATNTAGYFALVKSDDSTVVGTGSVGTSGADLNLNSLSISSGATVSCSAFTITGG